MKGDKQIQRLDDEEEQRKTWETWLAIHKAWLKSKNETLPEAIQYDFV